jgi:hypothetical protein
MARGTAYQNLRTVMTIINRFANTAVVLFPLLTLTTMSARASLFTLAASGTITSNSSGDATIPTGTPWSFEITYNTAAPDLDFELTGSPDPTFGRFNNTAAPPAMTFFHYKAGSYEVTLDDPGDFGTVSVIDITFTSINAIDINIFAPTLFPHLAGRPVSFHADFNRFVPPPVFSSDALPTNTAIAPGSFDPNTVSLLPQGPPSSEVSSTNVTGLTLTAGLAGDFNSDGAVNAADYVVWRKNFSDDQAKYDAWRANFGASLGPGSGSALPSTEPDPAPGETGFRVPAAAVPEPTTVLQLIVAAAGMFIRRHRAVARVSKLLHA